MRAEILRVPLLNEGPHYALRQVDARIRFVRAVRAAPCADHHVVAVLADAGRVREAAEDVIDERLLG